MESTLPVSDVVSTVFMIVIAVDPLWVSFGYCGCRGCFGLLQAAMSFCLPAVQWFLSDLSERSSSLTEGVPST